MTSDHRRRTSAARADHTTAIILPHRDAAEEVVLLVRLAARAGAYCCTHFDVRDHLLGRHLEDDHDELGEGELHEDRGPHEKC